MYETYYFACYVYYTYTFGWYNWRLLAYVKCAYLFTHEKQEPKAGQKQPENLYTACSTGSIVSDGHGPLACSDCVG